MLVITKDDITPTCMNCDFEEYCNHRHEGECPSWRPDLDYRRMLDSVRRDMENE